MKRLFVLFFIGSIVSVCCSSSQITKADYARADSAKNWQKRVYNADVNGRWLGDQPKFWYKVTSRRGIEYKMADAESLELIPAFDQERLCQAINDSIKKDYKPYELDLERLRFTDDGSKIKFQLRGYKWECNLNDYSVKLTGRVKENDNDRYWGSSEGQFESEPVESPDENWTAFVREYNLWVKNNNSKWETQLSFDGSAGEFYSGKVKWSPDSKMIAVNKVRPNEDHYIYFVESSPDDQLQPKLEKREYLKPGDALPIRKPRLFDVENEKQIPVDTKPFENQYSLINLEWQPDSKAFRFEFNERGHQAYQVVEVDAKTGDVSILIDEKSETFIDYAGKRFRHDLDSTNEIIWMSERDGWNHLYLIDAGKGKVKKQITQGEWVVRGVDHVDEENRRIIFRASGMNEEEDPYFIHYYSIDMDGKNLRDLTPENSNHDATFSTDYTYFIDTYSTVDEAPVTVLRSIESDSVLLTLEKGDIEDLMAEGWRKPEVFVAKARDGETDIWGNIYYPTNFDSTKTYPIIEYIYAGPHGSFAQKDFRAYNYPFSGLAELGFIIVQLDGMGTSHRSKTFHNVCYKNLKDAGFPDRIKWIKAAVKERPFMDTTRVGIFGGSAGAQSAMAALLYHPEFYKAAAASCGCHDNRMDKIWWNELWMGYPIGKHYAENSNVVNAHLLQGDLMLIVGELDDNVDPASTMQVADALIEANKEFELVVLPGTNHTLGGEYGERKRRDFFVKTFYNQLPPGWNKDN